MQIHRRRRARAGLIGGVSILASIASVTLTSLPTASASNLPPGNTVIIGSGSQTAYSLMVGLDDLFNGSQGCNEIASGSQTQSYSFNCAAGPSGAVGLPAANGENPLNDVAIQEPPLGGTAGLKQLEGQVPVLCTPSSPTCTSSESVSFSTTVRNPLPTDPTGLNFVNYADDALSWFHLTKFDGASTPSAKITNLTILDLTNIWNGTYTNWDQIPGAGGTSGTICVYVTNTSAGVYSLWQTYLNIPALDSYVDSLTTLPGCDVPAGQTYATSHTIEQNEDGSIIANGDEANAIFFFSDGRYRESCKEVACGGTAIPGGGTTALGKINGVTLNNTNIINGKWPTDIYLSNVYSDGSNGTIPAAAQATLNYVSEDGFLCKPQTSGGSDILDPLTGVWYRTEIANLINGQGDVPLALAAEGTVTNPAVLSSPYNGYDSSGTDPQGYCRVTTTDGNS